MHDVTIEGRSKKVAACCDELSRTQLLRLMPILYGAYPDPRRQRIEVLQVLLGISPALALRLTPVQWLEIFWLADFLLGEQLDFTKQLLPSVHVPWTIGHYHGPAANLRNVRFLEFVFADSYFVAYARTQQAEYRHFLLAVLYRPQRRHYRPTAASYEGDRREDFNENLLGPRAQVLARLPEAEQLAIVTWYRGCRRALEQRYPLVFTQNPETVTDAHADGWGHVLREMSGAAFGSFEETGRQHLHTVLAKLQDDIARAEQLRREAAMQKNSY